MSYKRIITIFVTIISISVIGYSIYSYVENYEEKVAFDYYLHGDYKKAEKTLRRVYSFHSSPRYILDLAYIARDAQSLLVSNDLLSESMQLALANNDNRLLLEIYLNQAYNGFLEKNIEMSSKAIANAEKVGISNRWIGFFQGLNEFTVGNYNSALKHWNRPIPSDYLSSWMENAFGQTFTMSWMALQIARCNIEEGNLKDTIAFENGAEQNTQKELSDVYFMLGLASIKEAGSQPIKDALPYWKQAFSYFNKIPSFHEKFAKEKSRLINDLYIHTKELINNGYVDELSAYMQLLELWKADAEITAIASQLSEFIQNEISQVSEQESKDIVNFLNHIIPHGEARQAIHRLFETELNRALANGNRSDIQKYWQIAFLFHPNQKEFAKNIISELEEEIPQKILQDDIHVAIVAPSVEFWNSLQHDEATRKDFEQKLLEKAFAVWDAGAQQKGLDLIVFVSNLGISDEYTRKEKILQELRRLYNNIEKQNQIEQLSAFIQAAKVFALQEEFNGPERIAIYLEDAQDLFNDERYNESRKKSQWILQMDANNEKAKRILEHSLRNIQRQNEALFARKQQENANKRNSIREQIDGVLDGSVSLEKLDDAPSILVQINKDDPTNSESYYLLGQVLFLLGDYQTSIEAYQKSLQLEPANLEGYKYLAVTQIRLGHLIEAVLALKSALELYPDDMDAKDLLLNLVQNDEFPNTLYFRIYQIDPLLAETIVE